MGEEEVQSGEGGASLQSLPRGVQGRPDKRHGWRRRGRTRRCFGEPASPCPTSRPPGRSGTGRQRREKRRRRRFHAEKEACAGILIKGFHAADRRDGREFRMGRVIGNLPKPQQVQHDDAAFETALHEKSAGALRWFEVADGGGRSHSASVQQLIATLGDSVRQTSGARRATGCLAANPRSIAPALGDRPRRVRASPPHSRADRPRSPA